MSEAQFAFDWEGASKSIGPWAHLQVVELHGTEQTAALDKPYAVTFECARRGKEGTVVQRQPVLTKTMDFGLGFHPEGIPCYTIVMHREHRFVGLRTPPRVRFKSGATPYVVQENGARKRVSSDVTPAA
jgi:hypothetical protein